MNGDATSWPPLGRLLVGSLGLTVAGIGGFVAVRSLEVGAKPPYGLAAGIVGLGVGGTLASLAVFGFET
jgi:hypothetical protein